MKKLLYCVLVAVLLVVLAGNIPAQGEGTGKAQTLCPVSGKAIKKDVYTDYNGKRIYFCCPGCSDDFDKDPARYVQQMESQGVILEKTPTDSAATAPEAKGAAHPCPMMPAAKGGKHSCTTSPTAESDQKVGSTNSAVPAGNTVCPMTPAAKHGKNSCPASTAQTGKTFCPLNPANAKQCAEKSKTASSTPVASKEAPPVDKDK